jgi:hypothetical protein
MLSHSTDSIDNLYRDSVLKAGLLISESSFSASPFISDEGEPKSCKGCGSETAVHGTAPASIGLAGPAVRMAAELKVCCQAWAKIAWELSEGANSE